MSFIVATILLFFQIPIQTDGVISDGEWTGGEQHDIGNNNKVMLKRDKDILYVALSGSTAPSWFHLYVSDGKRVKVMHSSAALGAINYKVNGSLWRTDDKTFVYELRDLQFTRETAAKMDAYYSKNGWVASNVNLGDKKTTEAKINLAEFKPTFFACVIATPGKNFSFPVDLKDSSVLTRLVQGYAVDSLKFEPTTWKRM
jgi:hypothetical protein